MSETVTTFAPDTPPHILSDYTEERCHELGLPCARDDNGLTVTVSAKDDGLPDWETFLRVAHELQGADGWVMEGAEPLHTLRNWQWWNAARYRNYIGHPADIPVYIFNSLPEDKLNEVYLDEKGERMLIRWDNYEGALADLSRACVKYSRSGVRSEL